MPYRALTLSGRHVLLEDRNKLVYDVPYGKESRRAGSLPG